MGLFSKITRTLLHVLAALVLLAAVVLAFIAIFFPAWQFVHIKSPDSEHQHGLWWDCTRGSHGSNIAQSDDKEKWHCDVKWKHKETPEEKQHHFLWWHKLCLGLFFGAAGTGLVALLCSFAVPCYKWFGIVWILLSFIASGLAIAGQAIFFIETHDIDHRLVHVYGGKYHEQEYGWVFYAGIACAASFVLSAFLSVAVVILVFIARRHESYPRKTWPQHHTAV